MVKVWQALLLMLSFNIYVWHPVLRTTASQLEIFVLDVGQGDSILVRTPDGYYGLIDGGKGNSVINELTEVMPWNQRKFDFVIATHPDLDHFEGLIDVFSRYEINNLLWTKSGKFSPAYETFKELVLAKGIQNFRLNSTDDFRVGCCVEFDVRWPFIETDAYHLEDANDASVAVIMKYNGFEMYLGGDLGGELELESVEDLEKARIDVLKVGHHGSKTSSHIDFLGVINPKIAIISTGQNNAYGHPAPEVLNNLGQIGADVWRTDLQGRVTIQTNGEIMKIFSEKGVEKIEMRV